MTRLLSRSLQNPLTINSASARDIVCRSSRKLQLIDSASLYTSARIHSPFLSKSLRNRLPRTHSRRYTPSRDASIPIRSGAKRLAQSTAQINSAASPRPGRHLVSKQLGIDFCTFSIEHPTRMKSNFDSWAILALVGIVSGAIFYTAAPGTERLSVTAEDTLPYVEEFGIEGYGPRHKMTGEALPGRPGTLTEQEEEKLKEFWIATLQVFGELEAKDAGGDTTVDPVPGVARAETKDKKKKKRLGVFRSSKKTDDGSETASVASTSHAKDGNDKYGQTQEFHEALASMTPETLRATFWSMVKHDHPDALLLRFLRARKWDVEKALVMMVSTMRWRSNEMHVDDDIMKYGELGALEDSQGSDPAKKKLGEDFLEQFRMGKSFLHGLDSAGRPMCFVRARLHKQGEQSEQSLERYTVFLIESARMVLSPPVDTACVVFDLTGFSLANMDYAPVKFMIKCFEANYPESLGVVLVHKAPWVFQGIWKIIRGWLDPVVASKVHFTNNITEMAAFVPPSQIISELAGPEEWTYKYIEPVPGENDLMKDTATRDSLLENRSLIVKEFESATLDWIEGKGEKEVVKTKRNEVANQLKEDYWKLDPYVRARSYYDRVGLIQKGGKLQFYPPKAEAAVSNGAAPAETSAADLD